jgi:hypothetical protein
MCYEGKYTIEAAESARMQQAAGAYFPQGITCRNKADAAKIFYGYSAEKRLTYAGKCVNCK